MALWKLTIKRSSITNNVRLEKGMSIEIVSTGSSDPLGSSIYKDQIAQLFMNKYGVDMKKACAINRAFLEPERMDK